VTGRVGPMGHALRRRPSLRARLAVVIVALVALTATVLGVSASAFVEGSLRSQLLTDARRQAEYDLAVLLPDALGSNPGRADFDASGLMNVFLRRGASDTIADFGDGDEEITSFDLHGVLAALPADLRSDVARGQLAYAWLAVAGRPALVIGGRSSVGGPALYFVHDASEIDRAVAQLRIALLVGALVLVLVALLAARIVARGILRPIDTAGRTAARIADGDLAARVPVTSADELGVLAADFNRMAATLEATIEQLRDAEVRNRRFVADVAHELRTPLTALVAEASVLAPSLADLPPDPRRAGELLVGDIARLRTLVEDLMELSRFDAGAEQVARQPLDVAARLRALVAGRLPGAALDAPPGLVVVETDPRRFDRIVGNLLDNAREHAPGAPVRVTVTAVAAVDEAGPGVSIRVADRGPGVNPPDLDRIFDRFATADPSRAGGSGLGLAIAREHARLLGGSLAAAPNPGGGLVVELQLPARPPGRPAVTESLPPGEPGVTSVPHPRS
jgi:signal transduction histidine kinase